MNWIALAFITAGTLMRFLPHPFNMTPIVALAIFSGRRFSMRFALALTLGTMLIGDVALGWVPQNLMGYLSLAAAVVLGAYLRNRKTVAWIPVLGAAVSSSLIFFLLSNFGVWLEGRLYPLTGQGLVSCYVAAVPFYKNQLFGDLLYTAVLFGGFQCVCSKKPALSHP